MERKQVNLCLWPETRKKKRCSGPQTGPRAGQAGKRLHWAQTSPRWCQKTFKRNGSLSTGSSHLRKFGSVGVYEENIGQLSGRSVWFYFIEKYGQKQSLGSFFPPHQNFQRKVGILNNRRKYSSHSHQDSQDAACTESSISNLLTLIITFLYNFHNENMYIESHPYLC